MITDRAEIEERIDKLVDEYRTRCLWFLRTDFYPRTRDQRQRVLGYIQRHGDRAAYVKAAEARRWLLEFQRRVCRLIAENRIASGESYVAGAAALNQLIGAARISRGSPSF